jgi:hypothetical protein
MFSAKSSAPCFAFPVMWEDGTNKPHWLPSGQRSGPTLATFWSGFRAFFSSSVSKISMVTKPVCLLVRSAQIAETLGSSAWVCSRLEELWTQDP